MCFYTVHCSINAYFSILIVSCFYISCFSVELQPRIRGWLLASVNGQKTGVVPANYVRVLGKRRGTRQRERCVAQRSDALPSTTDRIQPADVQPLQPATDDDWSLDDDDVNC